MNIKQFLHHRTAYKVLCVGLIIALVLGMGNMGKSLHTLEPVNPPPGNDEQVLELLTLGENAQEQELIDETDDETDNGGMSDEEIESEEQDEQEKTENQDQEEPEETPQEEPPEEDEEEDQSTSEEPITEEETESDDTDEGDEGDQPVDDDEGESGDEEVEMILGMVMTWYKYGKQPRNIVCGPSSTVYGKINTAQLVDDTLKYDFSLTGDKAANTKITSAFVKEGDGAFREIEKQGELDIQLPNQNSERNYTFQIEALWKTKDSNGKKVEQIVVFTYELRCIYEMDLELELSWIEKEDQKTMVICGANKTVTKTIESHELDDGNLIYTPKLIGVLAEDAKIIEAKYQTASGDSGVLNPEGGTLKLDATGQDNKETYNFSFTVDAKDEDGDQQTVYYHVNIIYIERQDIDLSFTWLEKGTTPRMMVCQPDGTVSTEVKNNQLSAGAVKYEIELIGKDSKNARILSISYKSEAGMKGSLEKSGALPLILPAGLNENTYTISVVALSNGKKIHYDIQLKYVMDVALEMTYSVMENGFKSQRTVICENGKTKNAEAIYDDQLTDGRLTYEMSTTGSENLTITSVKCYQTGSGRMAMLRAEDTLTLLLNQRKTGENTFTIEAKDQVGTEYEFHIMIPYKHRGEKIIKISTNMTDGQTVVNETKINLNVKAWSEDESGKVVSRIPANGEDTKLIVKLDGEKLKYVSTSGSSSEYILYPKNPAKGDRNEHTLYIYAEDPYGNFGELTITLNGKRKQAGQEKGTAQIYIDMTVLGLGIVESVPYKVLSNEPISYSVAKAILGMDTGEPFGATKNPLGWSGTYLGTLDTGFYLQSLSPGISAEGLHGSSWNKYGTNEEQILQAIDEEFGRGSGLATLWRCIYRNGLNKSSGSDGTYGEFDFTSGSGWLFSLDGTYYPGLSMSEYSLEDGDVLTLRYTLANGWDVGGGTTGYGNTIGYCVTALDGNFFIQHQMETIENEDGSLSYVCHCCGLEEGCRHENMGSKNLGDGTHVAYCDDCQTTIGSPELHTWSSEEGSHKCTVCHATEEHQWKEVEKSNTATCTEAGKRTIKCSVCLTTREEDSPAKGHKLNSRWNHTKSEHYQKCSACEEVIAESQGAHQYVYDDHDDDWYCQICDAGHDWDYCGNSDLTVESATCSHIIYNCDDCGMRLEKDGDFPDYHDYVDGSCSDCGEEDPSATPEAPENPIDPPEEDPVIPPEEEIDQ